MLPFPEDAARAAKRLLAEVWPSGPGTDLGGGEDAARATKKLLAEVLP